MLFPALHVVTGAFGYTGRYIASRLLRDGHRVRTLTDSPHRPHLFGDAVEVAPYHFDNPLALVESLRGAAVLYNTYWVRCTAGDCSLAEAERNTHTLLTAAKRAGVKRIVHLSIANASEDSPLPYFQAKARLEGALRESGLSYAILRPTVLFGEDDYLLNNLAWTLRHLPFFPLFGNGDYRLQPIHVDDLAALAVAQGHGTENTLLDAAGPETLRFRALVRMLGRHIGCPRRMVSVSPLVGTLLMRLLGARLKDVVITHDEMSALMRGLLCTTAPATGVTSLTAWARAHADTLGRHYTNATARRRENAPAQDMPAKVLYRKSA